MKPHEETWTAEGPSFRTDVNHVTRADSAGHTVSVGTLDSQARARLAAQAPAMARLLRRLMSGFDDIEAGALDETMAVLREAGVLP